MTRTYCLLIIAVAGAATLALEVVAARTMAPALGSGSVTWSALLAVALGTLAAGNLAGGWMCERTRPCDVVVWSLAASSACLLLLSQCYARAMQWLADCPLLIGAVAGAVVTQAVPLVMFGILTPTILRHGEKASGRWAGVVLAAGSGGGIVGALGAGMIALPGLGLARSYLVLAGLLALIDIPAAWTGRRWSAGSVLAALLAAVPWLWHVRPPETAVQSGYGQLEIRQTPTARVLLIDGLQQTGLPIELAPGEALRAGYLLEAALLMRPKPANALVIGLGAGLAPRLLAARGVDCESVEIDPEVVRMARDQFGFTGRVTIGDGRTFLRDAPRPYDLIFLDVCTSERLACHLFTVEGLQTLRRRLSPDGIAVIQFIGDDGPWSASLLRTVEAVFGRSLMLAGPRAVGSCGPRWLFAAGGPPAPPRQEPLVPPAVISRRAMRPTEPGSLLTDDHFPVELDWARTAASWRRGRTLYFSTPNW